MTTVTASGTFRMQAGGPGGWVHYEWIRHDNNGPQVISESPIFVAAGDTSAHAVATDVWTARASLGTEQLVFTTPSLALTPQPQPPFTCR